jgi:hypothetical protein
MDRGTLPRRITTVLLISFSFSDSFFNFPSQIVVEDMDARNFVGALSADIDNNLPTVRRAVHLSVRRAQTSRG